MLGLLVNRKHLEVYFLGLVIALQLAPDRFVWALVVVAGGIILSLLDRQKKKHRVTSEAVPSTSNQTAPKVNRKIAPPAAPAVRRYTRKQESSFPYPVPRRLPVEVAICEAHTKAGRRVCPIASGARRSLRAWHQQSPHAKDTDFVFPSLTANGKVPLNSCSFVKKHLRRAAKSAGVQIADGQHFGLHNLRHSLSNWLANKAKVEPKAVQGILRHSKIQTTLDLYTQEDSDQTRPAQGAFLDAMGMVN